MNNEKMININEKSLYSGNVKVEIYDNGILRDTVIANNTGTMDICRYLRDALAGDSVIAKRPGTIVPCYGDRTTLENIGQGGTGLFNKLPKKFDTEEERSSSCTLTFLIPSNILSASSTGVAGFRLYCKDNKTLYAEVNLLNSGLDSPITIMPGTNLKVTWTLTVRLV